MDLRIVKTKKAIREAFLELRRTLPLEKIKVTDICRKALINKTTFYKYYQDVFALSEELENEAMAVFWEGFTAKDCLLTDPYRFTTELPRAMEQHGQLLQQLIYDRMDVFFLSLEHTLKEHYIKKEDDLSTDTFLTFLIGGTLHTIRELKMTEKYDDTLLAENVAALVQEFIRTYQRSHSVL